MFPFQTGAVCYPAGLPGDIGFFDAVTIGPTERSFLTGRVIQCRLEVRGRRLAASVDCLRRKKGENTIYNAETRWHDLSRIQGADLKATAQGCAKSRAERMIKPGEDELTELVLGVAKGRVSKSAVAVFLEEHAS